MCIQSFIPKGMSSRVLSLGSNWAKSDGNCGIEFEERGEKFWIFPRTWQENVFHVVSLATLDLSSGDKNSAVKILGQFIDALGPDVAVAALSGKSEALAEAFSNYVAHGYRQKLIDYPTFHHRLSRRRRQRTALSVFSTLDPILTKEIIIIRLKGAETRYCMASGSALRRAILTKNLSMPHFVDVVVNIIGVWPLFLQFTSFSDSCILIEILVFRKEGRNGKFYLNRTARMMFRLFRLFQEICKFFNRVFHINIYRFRSGFRSFPQKFPGTQ